MMKKLIIPIVIFTLVSLGSCITIVEKYSINKDGSGKMEYIVDMSEMYSLMQTLSEEEDVQDLDVSQSFEAILPDLSILKGINNVEIAGEA